jgi:hypothetical protein
VVFEGIRLTTWSAVKDLRQIGLFKYVAATSSLEPIPFQIDKRRKINLKFNANDPRVADINVCEYGYFRELGVSAGSSDDNFASELLQPLDEVVFMLSDAGADQAPREAWLADPNVDPNRYEIWLTDPRTGALRWVYAFLWNSGTPTRSPKKYVSWTYDPQTPICTAYQGANSCGTASGNRADVPLSQVVHQLHFEKSWITDAYQVNPSIGFLNDMIERYRYAQAGETEDTWSNLGIPRFLGVFTNNTDKPVRVIRAVQGAASGPHTTKYEYVYATQFVSRVNLRVHPLSGLDAKIKQDSTIKDEVPKAVLWTETSFGKVPAETKDTIDGDGPEQEEIDQNSTYTDWSELPSSGRGTYLHFGKDLRAFPAQERHYTYVDKTPMQGDPQIGVFGRRWTYIGNTQDGAFPLDYDVCPGCAINDGGCDSDPEGASLNFARADQVMFPRNSRPAPALSGAVEGDDVSPNLLSPITLSTRKQHRDYVGTFLP